LRLKIPNSGLKNQRIPDTTSRDNLKRFRLTKKLILMKIIVIYASKSGNTGKIANSIAGQLNCEVVK
jgi:hypothetical protein